MDPTYKGLSVPTPTKTRSTNPMLRKALLIGGIVLAFFIVAGIIASIITPNTTQISQRMLYRVDALIALTKSADANISNDSLAKINTDLRIVLIGDYAALNKTIPSQKSTKELAKIKAEETDTATSQKLKTAKINAQYDSIYKDSLLQKIEATIALADELQSKTSRSSTKLQLTTLKNHLNIYYYQIKKLS